MSTSSGIPTYTSAPLNSNNEEKEQGTHTTTSHPEPATTIESTTITPSQPPNTSATATAPSYSPIYATAQPGAAPSLPGPTGSAAPNTLTATPTAPLPATTTISTQSPPPPQPGGIPEPTAPGTSSPVPPPPKAGEVVSPSIPSSTASASATATFTAQAQPHPRAPFTQSYTYQPPSQNPVPNSTSTPYNSGYTSHAAGAPSRSQRLPLHTGGGGGGGADNIFQDDEPGFMNTAKAWMQSAGAKLAEVEAEVWKRINDAHDEK